MSGEVALTIRYDHNKSLIEIKGSDEDAKEFLALVSQIEKNSTQVE